MGVELVVLFAPTVAFEYGQMIPGSETRAQRPWRGEGGPIGAEIRYKLTSPATTASITADCSKKLSG